MKKKQIPNPEQLTTMDISMENKGKLHGIASQLEKILHKKKVSLDEALGVLLTIKSLDVVLQDMILDDGERTH
jgi:hypothetical protein